MNKRYGFSLTGKRSFQKAMMASRTAVGLSTWIQCPAPGIVWRRAFGKSRWIRG